MAETPPLCLKSDNPLRPDLNAPLVLSMKSSAGICHAQSHDPG